MSSAGEQQTVAEILCRTSRRYHSVAPLNSNGAAGATLFRVQLFDLERFTIKSPAHCWSQRKHSFIGVNGRWLIIKFLEVGK